jgi:hypothetical protein
MVQKNVFAILFRKGALIPKFCIIERYKEFLFFIQFQCFFLNGLCWELSEVLRQISSFFYCFRDKIDQKMLKKSQFPKFEEKKISHPILMQFSCEVFILIGYLWTIKQICYFILKRGIKGPKFRNFTFFERYWYIEILIFIQFWCS